MTEREKQQERETRKGDREMEPGEGQGVTRHVQGE